MGYGDGSIWKNDRGTWTGFKTIEGQRYKRTGENKTAVRAAFSKLEKDIARGGPRSDSRLTVGAVVTEWLDRDLASRDRSPSTVSRHRWAADHITKHLGKKRVAKLKVQDVEKMLDALADDGLAYASLLKVRNTLAQSLRFAKRRGNVTDNVATEATIPAQAARTQPRRSLNPDEARTLLTRLREIPNGLAFAFSLRLGLRPGEAWGLHWSSIHNDTLTISRALRRDGGRVEIGDNLKTTSAARTITMPADLIRWADDHRREQTEAQTVVPLSAGARLMFPGSTGAPVSPSTSRKLLIEACQSAGVPTIRPNELRHSCASLLADEGVSNERIADLLGHTSTRMVDSTYRHRLRPVVDVAATSTWATQSG